MKSPFASELDASKKHRSNPAFPQAHTRHPLFLDISLRYIICCICVFNQLNFPLFLSAIREHGYPPTLPRSPPCISHAHDSRQTKASMGSFPRSLACHTVSPLSWVCPLLPREDLSLNYAPIQHFASVGPGLSKALWTLNFFTPFCLFYLSRPLRGSFEPAAECCLVPGSEKSSLSHPALHWVLMWGQAFASVNLARLPLSVWFNSRELTALEDYVIS